MSEPVPNDLPEQPSEHGAPPMKILIVEDDLNGLGMILSTRLKPLKSRFPDAEIILVNRMEDGLRVVGEMPHPDVTFLDLGLPDSAWEKTARRVNEFDDKSPVIIITGHAEEQVREIMRRPEIEILVKNPDMFGKLFAAIARALTRGRTGNLERARQNIRMMREFIDHAPAHG